MKNEHKNSLLEQFSDLNRLRFDQLKLVIKGIIEQKHMHIHDFLWILCNNFTKDIDLFLDGTGISSRELKNNNDFDFEKIKTISKSLDFDEFLEVQTFDNLILIFGNII